MCFMPNEGYIINCLMIFFSHRESSVSLVQAAADGIEALNGKCNNFGML